MRARRPNPSWCGRASETRMGTMVKEDDAEVPASSASPGSASDRRTYDRFDVTWSVDCVADDTFLYASIAHLSEMGIFVRTTEPLVVGTRMCLSFSPPGHEPFKLDGTVAWVN